MEKQMYLFFSKNLLDCLKKVPDWSLKDISIMAYLLYLVYYFSAAWVHFHAKSWI